MEAKYEILQRLYLESVADVLSDKDRQRLQTMLATDPEAQYIWDSLEKKGHHMQLQSFIDRIDEQQDLDRMRAAFDRPSRRLLPPTNWLVIAASLLLAVAASLWLWRPGMGGPSAPTDVRASQNQVVRLTTDRGEVFNLSTSADDSLQVSDMRLHIASGSLHVSASKGEVHFSTVSIPNGQTYAVTLPDGSRVLLNSATSLRFPSRFDHALRQVYLTGEAYFEITKDPTKPFVVDTESGAVNVLGTKFNVNTYERGSWQTAVVEGSVSMRDANGQQVTLTAGQLGLAVSDGSLSKIRSGAAEAVSWLEGKQFFRDVSLGQLQTSIMRLYDVPVGFARPEIAEQRISGLMQKGQLENFLSDLEYSIGVQYEWRKDTLFLK